MRTVGICQLEKEGVTVKVKAAYEKSHNLYTKTKLLGQPLKKQ
jgi:hypothetical protein